MREIKFRCWSKERKGIGIVTKICFLTNECDYALGKKKGDTDFGWTSLDNVILMQYTGLKDKNGNEIYEGDILKYREYDNLSHKQDFSIDKVEWGETGDSDGWAHERHFEYIVGGDSLADVYGKYCEIIGNIYENPEMIK